MTKTRPPIFSLTLTEFSREFTTITVKVEGSKNLIQFQGDGIWQWGLGVPDMSEEAYQARMPWLRAHQTRICWAEWLHDGLAGMHACVLYTGDTLAVLPSHPDYAHVAKLVELSAMSDQQVVALLKQAA